MDAVILRTTFALAAVLLVMWFCARLLRRSTGGRATDVIEVIGRQQLSKAASVAVVRIADRAYVLGITDGRVELVAETTLDAVRPAEPVPAREHRTPVVPPSVVPRSVVPRSVVPPSVVPASVVPLPAVVPAPALAFAGPVRDIVPEHRPGGVLAGSALSPATWRAGFLELRERSVRRP